MADYDHGYKHLFSHHELIRDLLRGFIREEWVDSLDLDTLERVSGSYVSDDLREREDDIIWRVRLGESWVYVYLIIEFQSTVDRHMALRLLTYVGLLYQDLLKTGQVLPDGMLPPVLPVVLYNGLKRWTAPANITELIQKVPGGLAKYCPEFCYLLLDEQCYNKDSLPARNLVSAIFRLEQSQYPEDVRAVVTNLIEWLKLPGQASIRRAFTVWINRVLLPARLSGQTIPETSDLMEVETMLSERVKEWTEEWKALGLREGFEEGMQEGMQQGMQQGMLQEAREMLLDAVETKFGPPSSTFSQRVLQMTDRNKLKELHRLVVLKDSLEDIENSITWN